MQCSGVAASLARGRRRIADAKAPTCVVIAGDRDSTDFDLALSSLSVLQGRVKLLNSLSQRQLVIEIYQVKY